MPRLKLDNLIIFGDSMSDIGNKHDTGLGTFANGVNLMQVNELGRFSDGRNWTDFLWEWAGGQSMIRGADPFDKKKTAYSESMEATKVHRSLTVDSNQDSGFGRPITFVNYAEGGAMGASDRPGTGLGTFRQQVDKFHAQRAKCPLVGETLFIIWFGLNDLVTNKRDPGTMKQVVLHMFALIQELERAMPGKAHFLLINLPDPADAAYFAKKKLEPTTWGFTKGAMGFNAVLAQFASTYEGMRLVDMYSFLKGLNTSLAEHGLTAGAQGSRLPVRYPHVGPLAPPPLVWGPPVPRLPPPPSDPVRLDLLPTGARTFQQYAQLPPTPVATSDKKHPTEAAYRVMAREIARNISARFELGQLSKSRECRGVVVEAA
ncbi:SGNH/GDSL hydrolase family protein [Myxococcus sp. K38C18041901]|uniref:SGNH/GDSL hydrolase family protein n=1 Tax=Myxococcus guangdongensis TaxID=2906760 RepID=UPI0020A7E029|nr:SGNH/GDSL hydrolase family protein [Myxococcus guangdongensis]MCP3063733.1 SGNH/GDSL hydrolase family protein [Myxococcus guangdongensis]